MKDDKIILVYYINIGNVSAVKGREILSRVFDNVRLDGVHNIILPIRAGDTRVECINPKLVTEEEYKSARDVLERAEKAIDDFLKDKREPLLTDDSLEETKSQVKVSFLRKLTGSFRNRKD